MKMNRKQQGFTLVEIMIVVAIIALLAAIAIPNLLRAKISANDALAKSTLRSLSTASETFATATRSVGPSRRTSSFSSVICNVSPPARVPSSTAMSIRRRPVKGSIAMFVTAAISPPAYLGPRSMRAAIPSPASTSAPTTSSRAIPSGWVPTPASRALSTPLRCPTISSAATV